jgi:enoyl-[acyl-carrier-protein] reductase (NADH)
MINFTRFAAAQLGPYSIRDNTVSRGGLDPGDSDPRSVERYSQRMFLGRMDNSTDLKSIVVFLASDASA